MDMIFSVFSLPPPPEKMSYLTTTHVLTTKWTGAAAVEERETDRWMDRET